MSLAGYRKGYLAHRLLRQTAVRLRLEQIRSRLQAQAGTGLPKETVLRELAAIAFADIGQTCDENGVPLPVNELPVEVRSAVQSYSRTRHGTAVKLYDKLTAIELSMRHLGLLQEQTGSGLTVQITIGTLAPSELDPILQAKAVVPSGNSTEPTD